MDPASVLLFVPTPGPLEAAIILIVVVLLFGANKVPKLARASGEAIGEFKKGREEVEQELSDIQSETAEDVSSAVDPEANYGNPNANTESPADSSGSDEPIDSPGDQ